MTSTIKYCLNSCDADLFRCIESNRVDLTERRCLEHCGICRDRPFAVVDGRVVGGSALSTVAEAIYDTGSEGR
jgi:uncharacterized protein YuzB (UPF0349 family)